MRVTLFLISALFLFSVHAKAEEYTTTDDGMLPKVLTSSDVRDDDSLPKAVTIPYTQDDSDKKTIMRDPFQLPREAKERGMERMLNDIQPAAGR